MKLNKYFMLGLAGLAFAACSNDDESNAPADNTEGKVYVSLSLGSAKTRSLGESAAGLHNNIENLKVFFYTGGNQYVNYTPDAEVLTTAVNELKTNHTTTIEFKDVPGSASKIYIIANEKSNNQIQIGSWADVENTDIYIANQAASKFDRFSNEKSTMTGFQNITDNTQVTLLPVTCRLEVQNIIAKTAPADFLGKDIEKFDVTGIYVNNFYTTGKLGNNSSNPNRDQKDLSPNFDATAYADYTYMYDEPTYAPAENPTATSVASTTTGEIWKVSPTVANHWWGYSVLKGYTPDLIIKLNVTYVGDTAPVGRYLTIQKYKKLGISEAVTTFERGNAYRIENLTFDATNLTEKPYEQAKTVSATVTVAPWTGVGIEPDFGK